MSDSYGFVFAKKFNFKNKLNFNVSCLFLAVFHTVLSSQFFVWLGKSKLYIL